MVQGWNVDENMDEIHIVESPCFVSQVRANIELEQMRITQPRTEWTVNPWRLDEALWQEGFERVK